MRHLNAVLLVLSLVATFAARSLAQTPPAPKTENSSKAGEIAAELEQVLKARGYVSTPLERNETGYTICPVSIAGKKFRLVVDTGCYVTCLDPERVKELNLDWIQLGQANQPDGFQDWDLSKVCKLQAMEVGEMKVKGLVVRSYNTAKGNSAIISRNERPVDGLLGADFLKEHSAILDYGSMRLFLIALK
jgi:predicted aspartyl protease